MKRFSTKKISAVIVLSAVAATAFAGCSKTDSGEETTVLPSNDDVEMSEGEGITIALQDDTAVCDSASVETDGSVITITDEGTYVVTGTLTDGQIVIDADEEDTVSLILDGCDITCSSSATIYVKTADDVSITLNDGSVNTLSNNGTFEEDSDDDVDGVIFSKSDLTIRGEGRLIISSSDHGIVCKDNLVIEGGQFDIDTDGDGIKSKETLTIDDGTFDISSEEAIEATYITINGGTIRICATDDGINASQKSDSYTPTIEINGGEITIDMAQGDTDAIDSNGDLMITGGTITITAQSAFDYDGTCEYVGGTIIVNGEEIATITNQFEGGMGPGGMQPPEGFDGSDGEMTPPEGNNGFGGDGMLPPDGGGTPPSGDPPPER